MAGRNTVRLKIRYGTRRVGTSPNRASISSVLALQKLLAHLDLQIMRRYLAQNNTDTQAAQMRGSPVDNGL